MKYGSSLVAVAAEQCIGRHAYDFHRAVSGPELHDLADGRLAGPECVGEVLIDDRDGTCRSAVISRQFATRERR